MSDDNDWGRRYAKQICDQFLPTGTRPYDQIEMSRQAYENALARAFVDGIAWTKNAR